MHRKKVYVVRCDHRFEFILPVEVGICVFIDPFRYRHRILTTKFTCVLCTNAALTGDEANELINLFA